MRNWRLLCWLHCSLLGLPQWYWKGKKMVQSVGAVKDAYPFTLIDMCLDTVGPACLFSTMDLQSGCWQLEVDEADRQNTAIITKYGLF